MTSEIWYKSYESNVDTIILVFRTTRYQILCTCIVSTGSEAYGMYLPLHLQPVKNSAVHVLTFVLYISSIRIVLDRSIQQYVCMVITYSKSMDQSGKVANPARTWSAEQGK